MNALYISALLQPLITDIETYGIGQDVDVVIIDQFGDWRYLSLEEFDADTLEYMRASKERFGREHLDEYLCIPEMEAVPETPFRRRESTHPKSWRKPK